MKLHTDIQKLPESEIEIKGELDFKELEKHRTEALARLNKEISLDGFRKGHIPEKVLVSHVGEQAVLEEAAEIALAHVYPTILADHKILPITRPQISITKLASGNPFQFTIRVVTLPEVKLGDYTKIAATENKKPKEVTSVTDKEVDEVILEIRKGQVDHSKHDHSLSKEEHDKQLEKEAPELTDEFVKKFGDFKNIDEFKKRVQENLMKEKEARAQEKRRLGLIDALVASSDIDVPKVLIENELNRMTEQFKGDLGRMNVTFEDYLTHIKKTADDIRKEWHPEAVKKVKLQLILNKIASDEKIVVSEDEVKKEVDHILAHYKDADPERARDYVEMTLTNEKVFGYLEGK